MCASQGWKSTGDKSRVLKRVVKKLNSLLKGRPGVEALLESRLGDPTRESGSSSLLRRFYTNNYPALDRFDRLWYEIKFFARPRDWESHFCWSFLHATVVNARAIYCAATSTRISIIDFLRDLVDCYAKSLE
jgi:hypothetical protein